MVIEQNFIKQRLIFLQYYYYLQDAGLKDASYANKLMNGLYGKGENNVLH